MPAAPQISIDDIALDQLTSLHRDVMLDLILVWGKLDGAMGMMVAKALDKHPVEGADFVREMSTNARFHEVYKQLRLHPPGSVCGSRHEEAQARL